MRKSKMLFKKIISVSMALMAMFSVIPEEVFTAIDLSPLFNLFTTKAFAAENDITEYTAPTCSFMDELYDGSDAIAPLPSYKDYKEQTGYTEPLRISYSDFRAACGEGLDFNAGTARKYMADGYKLMICDATELYNYSMLVNSGSPEEISFYLSANIVLGNNIEYSEVSGDGFYFKPIGNDVNAFTGTFDGQNFEIRDLYFDTDYSNVTFGFFGVVGEGANVCNFGILHPTINAASNSSTLPAAIASRNYGTIDSVYAIAQEYRDPAVEPSLNVIESSNARYTAGLVAVNYQGGVLSNSYFAGMLHASSPEEQNPVCASNSGTITNCYYDKDVFSYGLSGSLITEVTGEITGLTNIDLKKVGISENGMTGTKFKHSLAITASVNYLTDAHSNYWLYPRLYGFTGTGTEDDPYIISTPADLIYFPTSYEYACRNAKKYFQLANCIDMNEVAPNAYKPKLTISNSTNYLTGGKWTQSTYIPNNIGYNTADTVFYGTLSGAAHNGDADCPIHHTGSRGNAADGSPLQECHAILNLTIDTPAFYQSGTTVRHYSALIARTNSSKTITSTVTDLNFIGGEISSGDGDCMPATYNYTAYNLRIATVIAESNYSNLNNVHSSATVKIGTGKCYSVLAGGLMAGGYYHNVTDCTNSGDVIGGYINMPDESIQKESFIIGGLLGYAGSNNAITEWKIGKLTHVANYGNVYGAVVVADKDSGWTITTASIISSGISGSALASGKTGDSYDTPEDIEQYYYDDSRRCDRIANFGMIFDGPITLDENGKPVFDENGKPVFDENGKPVFDENGKPVFDENGKPVILPLDENKELVANNSLLYDSYIYGIGANIISHAYNEANLYSVTVPRTHIVGIGAMTTEATTQYYNFLNYNKGNIYMYAGASEAHGVSDMYAYKCYNAGDIILFGGVVNTRSTTTGCSSDGGSFSGISGISSKGCYNDGDIYIAPSARSIYNNGGSNSFVISACGVSQIYSSGLTETDSEGNTIIIPSINAGTVTVDLDKYNFDPVKNTTSTASSYYPYIYMQGTGLGSYNENYGKLNFVPNTKDETNTVQLYMSPLGGRFINQRSASMTHCRNYADLSVDTSNAPGALYALVINGLGYVEKNSSYSMNDCVNFGDISFKGRLGGGLWINSIGGVAVKISNCLNIGDVTVDPSSEIGGNVTIRTVFTENTSSNTINYSEIDSVMNGWYDGCKIPPGLDTDEYREIFNSLDKTKRYGQFNISGTFTGSLYLGELVASNSSYVNKISNIINNGAFNVENLDVKGGTTIRGLSGNKISDSANYAPITVNNVLFRSSSYISGAAPGNNNLNLAPITVTHSVCSASNIGIYVAGVTAGASNAITSATNCENRGEITVKDCYSATVKGVDYASPLLGSSATKCYGIYYIGGIGTYSHSKSCVNFADISVSDVTLCYVGGVCSITSSTAISNSYNYGDIKATNCSGASRYGGIAGYIDSTAKITGCFNFGKLSVIDPYSYVTSGYHQLFLGGICGQTASSGGISSSANCGEVEYINSNGENTDNKNLYNTRTLSNYYLYVGGITGYKHANTPISNTINYADINVQSEMNTHMSVGGAIGRTSFATNNNCRSSSLVNYGNVTVPDANASKGQVVYGGGIIGAVESAGSGIFRYGINYGTVQSATEKAANTYVGAILGRSTSNNMKFTIDRFVDLSDTPDGWTYYPMMGSCYSTATNNNGGASVNYTKNQQSVDDTTAAVGERFGTVKAVTLDKQENGGLFSADFAFRSDLLKEITAKDNSLNGLMYQDYDLLSPYLQRYMVSRFGDDIKNYGAYVVLFDERSTSRFMPGRRTADEDETQYHAGIDGSFNNADLVKDTEINQIYSQMVAPAQRTISTDYYTYLQQVQKSSMAEIFEVGVKTKYQYSNYDTSHYQVFDEYQSLVETHTAYDKNGNASDTVLYTDINFYIAIDSIDPYRARQIKLDENGNTVTDEEGNIVYESVETNGYIYINQDFRLCSQYSKYQIYKGDTVDTNRRTALNHYTDNYPDPWLTADNLETELEQSSADWSDLTDLNDDKAEKWEMAIPYQDNDDTKYVYTKVLGVFTAEDGVHKNIVVAHVVIDRYNPYSELDSVTLQTPKDATLTSNNEERLTHVSGQPSLTDYYTEEDGTKTPKNDVTYYYLTDDNLTGENIQKYVYTTSITYPKIIVTTKNMDETFSVSCSIKHQDRLPDETTKYNELEWNDQSGVSTYCGKVTVNPTNIVYDDEQKSVGTATFNLGKYFYYGGLYRLDLFYERTKASGSEKHFATIFVAKQHSPRNVVSYWTGGSAYSWNPAQTLQQQTDWDASHPPVDGLQSGFYIHKKSAYNNSSPTSFYFSREKNDCLDGTNTSYGNGNGAYYSLKGYMGENKDSTVYLDTANPIYNDSEVKGKPVTLKNSLQSIEVFSDEETGAYYPMLYHMAMDIMAENGDIRRYDYQFVQNGKFVGNEEEFYNNNPNIYQSSASKNGFPIVKGEDGSFTGVIEGDETLDSTFVCQWESKNVSLYANGYYKDDIRINDGYGTNKLDIFLTETGSSVSRKLTDEEKTEYFSSIGCNTSNAWTFKLKNSAPTGTYSIVPYMTYTNNFTALPDNIKLYDSSSGDYLSSSEDNIITWTIPYSSPFVIENRPNDDSYMTEFDVSNDRCAPFLSEVSDVDGGDNREVYIRSASENQSIVYVGYDDVKTGDNRVDKFNIFSYAAKDAQQSSVRMKAPYRATISKWTGMSSPFEQPSSGQWEEMTPDSTVDDCNEYIFDISYNELNEDGEYSYSPYVAYYKVIAEDEETSTVYTVNVVPGVRNKDTSLEIAQSTERINGEASFKEEMTGLFAESEAIYREILDNSGYVTATIKELSGDEVDVYQTKIFNAPTSGETQPYVYNLKSFAFDISVDLPAGYDYDLYLFSTAMDYCTKLKNSQNGFSGKQLVLSSSDDQQLHLRIVLKRDTASTVWGVQYIWNFFNANVDTSGRILNIGGGDFYNYVYNKEETQ